MTDDEDLDQAVERAVAANGHDGARIGVPAVFTRRYQGAESADTFEGRVTRCYELALRAQMTFANHGWTTTLVHGVIGPRRNPHAWVEWRDTNGKRWMWDPVLDGVMPGTHFRDHYMATEWSRYTPREASRLSEGSNGPWGVRDAKRAIACIEDMMRHGSSIFDGMTRITQIRADNGIKEERHG